MDVEIVKKSGEVFRLSDYGVVQDFVVSSIDKRTHRENIDGRPGAVNYGSYDGDRTITVPFIFKARDLHDYTHLRDELYGLLDDDEPFYIREMRRLNYLQYEFVDFGEGHKWSPGTDNRYVNGKQILVRLNSVITPEQEFKNGKVALEFVSDELPYFESIYTTLELHDSGYSATAEKYGLVDNIDDEKVKYRFNENLMSAPYDYRSRLDSPFEHILSAGLPVGDYTISFDYEVLSGNPSGFLVYSGSSLTTVTPTGGRVSANFSISSGNQNTSIRLYGDTGAVASRSTDVLFKDIKIERGNQATPFIFGNDYQPNLIPLNEGDWENGSRWSSGSNNNNSNDIRLKMEEAIPIVDGRSYTIHDSSTYNSRFNTYMVHCFDDEGNMTHYFSRSRGTTLTFTARGTKLVISLIAMDGFAIPTDYIEGDRLSIKLEEGERFTGFEPSAQTFNVYNAGNVTIEPESMYLHIIANTVTTPGGFTIANKTTGEEFVFNEEITTQSILLRGMDIRVSSIYNRFRDTNRRFISLAPGDNEFEVSGGTFNHIRFDFRYLYK